MIDLGQHGPGLLQQHGPRGGQPDALAPAVQQRRADDLLQAPDLLAQRRLGDVHPLRRMGEGARVGNRHEVAQMPEFHAGRGRATGARQRDRPCACQLLLGLVHPGHLRLPACRPSCGRGGAVLAADPGRGACAACGGRLARFRLTADKVDVKF